jgi:hypothetical protein
MTSCKSSPNSAVSRESSSTTTKRSGTLNDRQRPFLKVQSELLKQRLALYSYLHISLAFTSAIRPHTSDIFQPYFACKDTPFLLISHAKTENVISWKIDFTQVQKQNHSYDSTSPSCHTYVFYALTIKFFLNYTLL